MTMEIINCKKDPCADCGLHESDIKKAVKGLKDGKLVVYPTETVYGLGANPFDEAAVKRVYMAKNRPFDMPLSIAVADIEMMEDITVLSDDARKLVRKFLPGPLTLIVKKKPRVPDIVTYSSENVGIRIPDHPLALRLIREFGPIIATSANLHSHPDAVEADAAKADLGNNADMLIDCGPCRLGKPSTIIYMANGQFELIRAGAITREEIEAALNE
jgi:L-threonylcarbamoyladenylate synthase